MSKTFRILLLLLCCPLMASASSDSHLAERVVIFGDSNTWIGGDACDNPRGWNKWFAEVFRPASCRSYARSGATLTHTASTRRDTRQNVGVLADNNVVTNQIFRFADDLGTRIQPPTIVIIAAGTNDLWFADKRPEAMSDSPEILDNLMTDTLSFSTPLSGLRSVVRALAVDVWMLRELLPKARIIIMSPLQSVRVAPESLERMAILMEECCRRLDVDFIRQDTLLPVNAEIERISPRLTTDGTHTSEEGAEINGILLAREVDRIISRPDDR